MANEKDTDNSSNEKSDSSKIGLKDVDLKSSKKESEKKTPTELFNAKSMPKMSSGKSKNTWVTRSIIGLLLVTALLISGWTAYQQYRFNENWAESRQAMNTQISQQNKAIKQIESSRQISMEATNQTQLQLNQLVLKNKQLADSLFSTQEKIKALSGRQKQDWMLAEAAYLIKVAQLQLSLQKDKSTATQLLRTADSRIIEIADNSLLPIREAIAQDLSELSLIFDPDVTGISLALDAINQQIPNLKIIAFQFEILEESLPSEETNEFDLSKIYQNFLKDFVVIKDHSEPVKPLMTSDQRVNLNNNIQLAIQQAQVALLQGNETLFRLYIANAILWTEQFFIQDEKSKNIVNQLKELQEKPVEAHYPNKLNAKQAIDDISKNQLYRWLDNTLSGNSSKSNVNNDLDINLNNNLTNQDFKQNEALNQSEIKP